MKGDRIYFVGKRMRWDCQFAGQLDTEYRGEALKSELWVDRSMDRNLNLHIVQPSRLRHTCTSDIQTNSFRLKSILLNASDIMAKADNKQCK
jgi:hypothetical protein